MHFSFSFQGNKSFQKNHYFSSHFKYDRFEKKNGVVVFHQILFYQELTHNENFSRWNYYFIKFSAAKPHTFRYVDTQRQLNTLPDGRLCVLCRTVTIRLFRPQLDNDKKAFCLHITRLCLLWPNLNMYDRASVCCINRRYHDLNIVGIISESWVW